MLVSGMDEVDQEKLKKRAERFGDMLMAPPQTQPQSNPQPVARLKHRAKPARRRQGLQQEGFKTGIDVYSPEELAKRQSRAKRFEIQEKALEYQPPEKDPDEEQRRRRAERFGTQYQAIDQSGLASEDILEARKDRDAAVERRPECVHVHGVDRLSTREVQAYFQGFGPQRVEWIDDSCCNVVFADEHSAKRAMAEKGRPLEIGLTQDGEDAAEDSTHMDTSDIRSLPFLWHRGPDFIKDGSSKVPLIFRMATVADKKGAAPAHPPRYLWLRSGQKGGQSRGTAQKRKPATDADGNIEMADANDRPGAAKRARRSLKRVERQKDRARAHSEVAMGEAAQDGEAAEVSVPANGTVILPAPMDEDDPAELGTKRAKQRAEGPSGLFSAAQAGVWSADSGPDVGDSSPARSGGDESA